MKPDVIQKYVHKYIINNDTKIEQFINVKLTIKGGLVLAKLNALVLSDGGTTLFLSEEATVRPVMDFGLACLYARPSHTYTYLLLDLPLAHVKGP